MIFIDRNITKNLINQAEQLGATGLFITVDAPQLGRREKDMRVKFVDEAPDVQNNDMIVRNQGAARAISSFIDPSLSWDDLPELLSLTKLPVFIKGIQSGEDAILAAKAGVQGIVISNHGGRQLDTVPSSIEILEQVMIMLRQESLDTQLDVYIDGGIRRGTDIFKAIALGAKAIGIGRPFLYAMSSYGQSGVERAIELLQNEFEMVMRLMGVVNVSQITSNYINVKNLSIHVGRVPHVPSISTMNNKSRL